MNLFTGRWISSNQFLLLSVCFFIIVQVKTGANRTLNAQVAGTLRLTTEHNPDKEYRKRITYFSDVLEDEKKLQTVVHVVPDEQHWRFKLVEQIWECLMSARLKAYRHQVDFFHWNKHGREFRIIDSLQNYFSGIWMNSQSFYVL